MAAVIVTSLDAASTNAKDKADGQRAYGTVYGEAFVVYRAGKNQP